MICFPNAKINLGLNIVSKRDDGYHNLETIFYPIGLKDALEIIESNTTDTYNFYSQGIKIDGNLEDNLIIKAYHLLAAENKIPPIDIHFIKNIPFGAGLGGGSSDAAFMLKLLNDTFLLGYSTEELERKAVKLGADCPFFIKNKPAFAEGIGDKLTSFDLDLKEYNIVLVKPDVFVSTKEAYSLIIPQSPEFSLREIIKKPVSEWKKYMKNDFEKSVFSKYPEIENIKNKLYEMGALYASMSGSGSSVFGIFKDTTDISSFQETYFNVSSM